MTLDDLSSSNRIPFTKNDELKCVLKLIVLGHSLEEIREKSGRQVGLGEHGYVIIAYKRDGFKYCDECFDIVTNRKRVVFGVVRLAEQIQSQLENCACCGRNLVQI